MSKNQVAIMAERLSIDPSELQSIVISTVMPQSKGQSPVTNEQFVSFLAVANEYNLNPMVKEIYAFPTKGGGIQPIVSIDGWLKIINTHPQFNGMQFKDSLDANGNLASVTCQIFRKDRQHPIEVTEYMNECKGEEKDKWGNPTPWGRWPARMLRHKAAIQAARYAFSLSGIIDPDEAERFKDAGVIQSEEKEMGAAEVVAEAYSQSDFDANFPKWEQVVTSGKKSAADLIAMIETKAPLSEEQKAAINNIGANAA